jgi:hypothetical protein
MIECGVQSLKIVEVTSNVDRSLIIGCEEAVESSMFLDKDIRVSATPSLLLDHILSIFIKDYLCCSMIAPVCKPMERSVQHLL